MTAFSLCPPPRLARRKWIVYQSLGFVPAPSSSSVHPFRLLPGPDEARLTALFSPFSMTSGIIRDLFFFLRCFAPGWFSPIVRFDAGHSPSTPPRVEYYFVFLCPVLRLIAIASVRSPCDRIPGFEHAGFFLLFSRAIPWTESSPHSGQCFLPTRATSPPPRDPR